jgi:hypothetical protein
MASGFPDEIRIWVVAGSSLCSLAVFSERVQANSYTVS